MTERVPGRNRGTFPKFAPAYALSGSPLARQLPHRGSQGRLRRRGHTSYPLRRLKHIVISVRRAGEASPLALPLGELARCSRD